MSANLTGLGATLQSFVTAILAIAQGEVGKSEHPKGSNWGIDVQKYLASVNIHIPSPWCMGFVVWVLSKACEKIGIPNVLKPIGHVLTQWHGMDKRYRVTRVGNKYQIWDSIQNKMVDTTPRPGDIAIMDFKKNGQGHTFIVEAVEGTILHTIEGNSNDDGSREGYEVCRHPHGRDMFGPLMVGFIRVAV